MKQNIAGIKEFVSRFIPKATPSEQTSGKTVIENNINKIIYLNSSFFIAHS